MILPRVWGRIQEKRGGEGCAIRKAIVCLLLAAMVLALSACGDAAGGLRVIETYESEGGYVMAFRKDDRLCELVTAVMQELAANGTLRTASLTWFGDDLIATRAEKGAMDDLRDSVEPRTLYVGVNADNLPLSAASGDGYQGFDVDVANYVCGYLGWSMVLRPIGADDIGVQLASGNIDCAMGVPVSEKSSAYSYTPEYLSGKYVLVTRLDGPRSRVGLRGKTLGILTSDMDLLELKPKFVASLGSIIYQTGTASLFAALSAGEVDGVLVSSPIAAYYMR